MDECDGAVGNVSRVSEQEELTESIFTFLCGWVYFRKMPVLIVGSMIPRSGSYLFSSCESVGSFTTLKIQVLTLVNYLRNNTAIYCT